MSFEENRCAGRAAGLFAAAWPPVFTLLFFVLFPALGLELGRLGDPHHALPFFAEHPGLIRLTGVGNVGMIVTAIVFATCLARILGQRAPVALLAGLITVAGWLVYLTGELCDLAAYVNLPATYERDADVAAQAYVTLQTAGRMIHGWGYAIIGVGLAGFARALRGHDSRLRALAAIGGLLGLALFGIEYFVISLSGDAGGAHITLFASVLLANITALTSFHWVASRTVLHRERP